MKNDPRHAVHAPAHLSGAVEMTGFIVGAAIGFSIGAIIGVVLRGSPAGYGLILAGVCAQIGFYAGS